MGKEKILKIAKNTFWYLIIFCFATWAQCIVVALFCPVGGGEFHILFQLESSEIPPFLLRAYGYYLLVGVCTAFLLSLLKRTSAPIAVASIASFVPIIKWSTLMPFILENVARPYFFVLLGMLILIFIVAASYLGVGVRKLIFFSKRKYYENT